MARKIELTNDELSAFGTLQGKVMTYQQDVVQAIKSRNSFIDLLEIKYKAKFNHDTGFFEPVVEPKTKEVSK